MREFGIYPSAVRAARSSLERHEDLLTAVTAMYTRPAGEPDGLGLALLHEAGSSACGAALAAAVGVPVSAAERALAEVMVRTGLTGFALTGAEATAMLLARAGTDLVFAYPGTSELALCDAVARHPALRLVNSRGDKEAAFMAAGASLIRPARGAAIVHGARGLTNAMGGVADARRGESGSLVLVGLPSTASARFLPPHGEEGLLPGLGRFAKSWYELSAGEPDAFLSASRRAAGDAITLPYGPVLAGLPQDVAERAWIPYPDLRAALTAGPDLPARPEPAIEAATAMVRDSARIVILMDDYLLRYPNAAPALRRFCARTGAVILQVRYARGPMLFDQLKPRDVAACLGWLDPANPGQRRLLEEADLLITLEDRNMYRRVVGRLPGCAKLAITSDPAKARKNDYLRSGDLLLTGDVTATLDEITRGLAGARAQWTRSGSASAAAEVPRHARELRELIGEAVTGAMAEVRNPVLVDDSQMFGGLLAEAGHRFPRGARIFGDHGGFVGSGIGYATGLALAMPESSVLCTLGDQGFGNGLQGLVAAVERSAPVVFVLCNNGGSVSLRKQAASAGQRWFDSGAEPFLDNAPLHVTRVAAAFGLSTERLDFTGVSGESLDVLAGRLRDWLVMALTRQRPALIELMLPADEETWAGIWISRGFDEAPRTPAPESEINAAGTSSIEPLLAPG